MRSKPKILFVAVLLTTLFLGLKFDQQRSRNAELLRHPGQQWLSWTQTERDSFVYGYVVGYSHGTNTACIATDELFETDKKHAFGHDDVPSTFPSARCRARVPNYTSVKVDLSKGQDFTAYTSVITDFYTRHPDYRDTPFIALMESLVGPDRLTADDLYSRMTK